MTALHSSPATSTTDMVAIHQVFRQALAEAPALVRGAQGGDAGRVALVASYYDNVMRFLQAHHQAEDDLLWPKLLERCPTDIGVVQRMTAHHQDIHRLLDKAMASVQGWAVTADPASASQPIDALADLADGLIPHLDEEEATIVPLCAQHLSSDEWAQMPGYAAARFHGDKPWLILGLIQESMAPAQRQAMLQQMPPPVRQMWVDAGASAFAGLSVELRRRVTG